MKRPGKAPSSKPSKESRELEKLTKKIAGGRATTGAVQAVHDAAALLALGHCFDDALRIFRRLAESPKEIVRLATDAWDTTYFRRPYHQLAAVAATAAMREELALSTSDMASDVEEEQKEFRTQRAYYLQDPGSSYGATPATTKMVEAMARHLDAGKPRAALEIGRKLVESEVEHWTLRLENLLLAADVAHAAGEEQEALRSMARAAETNREGSYGLRSEELRILLSFEFSARGLARGELGGVELAPEVVAQLVSAVGDFFGRILGAPEPKVDWSKLLKKLAGARGMRAGATDAELASLEGRLKAKLPEEYRAVLKVSNGLARSKVLRLWSTSEVEWFRKTNADWIAAYVEEGADIAHLADTLQISEAREGEVYLLNPKVKTKDGSWEAWVFANHIPGDQRYTSLAQLVEDLIEDG
jgi:hypothetical protein